MSADPFTPAELEAGAEAIREWRRHSPPSILDQTAAVLRAVLPQHAARVRAEAEVPLLSLIEDLTDDGDCWYDHHGYCQGHSLHEKPCPHERAKRLLARAHATTPGDDHAE